MVHFQSTLLSKDVLEFENLILSFNVPFITPSRAHLWQVSLVVRLVVVGC